MPSISQSLDVEKIRRNLRIPLHREDVIQQIAAAVSRCHFERLRLISVQIGKEREKAIESKNKGLVLSSRETSLLICNNTWRMVITEYSKEIKKYSFMFAAFNILEDSIRITVLEKYRDRYGISDWHIDDSKWPAWLKANKIASREHTMLLGLRSSSAFLHQLSFGELVAFLYDYNSWTTHGCQDVFNNKIDPEDASLMPNLTRCAVFEKMKILQSRRNIVFHHQLLEKEYNRPTESGNFVGVCNANRNRRLTDGNVNNTIDRIIELMKYMGHDGKQILQEVSPNGYTF